SLTGPFPPRSSQIVHASEPGRTHGDEGIYSGSSRATAFRMPPSFLLADPKPDPFFFSTRSHSWKAHNGFAMCSRQWLASRKSYLPDVIMGNYGPVRCRYQDVV